MSGAGRRPWPVRESAARRKTGGYSWRNFGSSSEQDAEGLKEFRKYAVFRPAGVAKGVFGFVNF
jgi:hypothetical protein